MKRILFSTILCCVILCSCGRTEPSAPFIASENVQLRIGGRSILDYNALNCQISFDSQIREFVVCNDDGGRYYAITMSEIPGSQGQQVVASLEWTTTLGSVRTKKNVTLDVVKFKGNKIWLWNSKQDIEACIQILL